MQNLLLAAAALGYGSAMTTPRGAGPGPRWPTIVGLPDGVRPFAVVPSGGPRPRWARRAGDRLGEVAHLDVFGMPLAAVSRRAARSPAAPPPRPPA